LEEYVPNIHIRVDLVGEAPRLNIKKEEDLEAPKRPAFASGQIQIVIPPVRIITKISNVPSLQDSWNW
jgi:hypothetical protein